MIEAIQMRYDALAESECCLSCGGAVNAVDPKPGQVCIDLGSGRGTDVLRLAEAVGPTGHAYGVEVAEGMRQKARKTADKMGISNATFIGSSFERVALPDAVADWIISNCAINHASDKVAVWREIARMLKPGGSFVVSDIYALEAVPAEYRDDPAAVAECWAGAILKDEYLSQIALAGLVDVRVIEESQPYAKGKTTVASFTVTGTRFSRRCCS